MADVILGVGRVRSVREVVDRITAELRITQGAPRKVTAQAGAMTVTAEREAFDGPYTAYDIEVRKCGPKVLERLQETANSSDGYVTLEDREGGGILIRCAATQEQADNGLAEAVDAISGCMGLPENWHMKGDRYNIEHISTQKLFQAMIQYKASDVHLAPGEVPVFRVDNDMHRGEVYGNLSAPQLLSLLREITTDQYWEEFRRDKQTSFNYHQAGLGYSRVSAFMKAGAPHITFRFLPETIPSFDDLNIPSATMTRLGQLRHGLVMVVGMTGSGKSTTVAALVDWINRNEAYHILTIENPVEYVHHNRTSLISQRDIGVDVDTFGEAVRGALRHDPDVIVIGEMRDPDTIRAAINAAATGHLVITTLHSSTAYDVVARLTSFFDPIERDLVRMQLRECIQCIICQRLLAKRGGGRLPAIEMLFNDVKAITDGILSGDADVIRIGMQQSTSHSFLFESYIHTMLKEGKIDADTAHAYCTDPSILDQMIMGTYTIPRLESIKHMGSV